MPTYQAASPFFLREQRHQQHFGLTIEINSAEFQSQSMAKQQITAKPSWAKIQVGLGLIDCCLALSILALMSLSLSESLQTSAQINKLRNQLFYPILNNCQTFKSCQQVQSSDYQVLEKCQCDPILSTFRIIGLK